MPARDHTLNFKIAIENLTTHKKETEKIKSIVISELGTFKNQHLGVEKAAQKDKDKSLKISDESIENQNLL